MSVVNNGYHLRKTGERVNELLSRQFIVPTLSTAPTSATLKWKDGEYDVYFRVGEMCRVRQDDEWVFYRLDDIANGKAFWSNANASELPDMGDYYTKDEVDDKIKEYQPNLSEYYTKDEVDTRQTYRVYPNNSSNNFGGVLATSKNTAAYVRPICEF